MFTWLNRYLTSVATSFLLLGFASFGAVTIYRHIWPHTFVLVAGKETGESYILSAALAEVVNKRSCKFLLGCNVKIKVLPTDGTDSNLRALTGRLSDYVLGDAQKQEAKRYARADLATAQADRIAESITAYKEARPRTVSTLFTDTFQLVINPNSATNFDSLIARLSNQKAKRYAVVEAPLRGGQCESFKQVMEHFGLQEGTHFSFVDFTVDLEEKVAALTNKPETRCLPNQAVQADAKGKQSQFNPAQLQKAGVDAVFRVRILGNEDVRTLLDAGWQLLAIDQSKAMSKTKHPTFQSDTIPRGTYRGGSSTTLPSPVPKADLETISIARLLLARADVPDWLVYEIVAVLQQEGQELADVLERKANAQETAQSKATANYLKNYVLPLVSNIPRLNRTGSSNSDGGTYVNSMLVELHPGARSFYKPGESFFSKLNENANGIGLFFTIPPALGGLYLWLKQFKKDRADEHIKVVASLMKGHQTARNQPSQRTAEKQQELNQLRQKFAQKMKVEDLPEPMRDIAQSLINWREKLDVDLNWEYNEAYLSLINEDISQESFRTFKETFETTREFIERKIEEKQRDISSYYIEQVINLLDKQQDGILSSMQLEQVRDEAIKVLRREYIFSRESFRTFIEAYNLVREALLFKMGS